MKHLHLIAALIVFTATPVLAQSRVIDVKVLGMVCDFCAQSVLKVFKENESITDIDINLDEGLVKLTIKDGGTISDEEINEKIEYGGYSVDEITRP